MNAVCPNVDIGAGDVAIRQEWTHDYPSNPADRSRVWTVTGLDSWNGHVWLNTPNTEAGDGHHGFITKRVGIGSLLAYWTKVG